MEPVIRFASAKEWERWLARNHNGATGIWLRISKKDSKLKSVTGAEALDVALCYGWITGQAKRGDEASVLWRFCPRRPKSIWSKLNTMHAERLIREGRMKPAGLEQIKAAKLDGRWARAYHPPSTATLPRDFLHMVNRNEKAKAFLKTLNRQNRYAIIFRLATTKDPARRKRKIYAMIERLEEGRAFY
ncbi:MAG: YdeI/OmpD-associated family protein [Candidatus Micrarchaeota archaeon]|nr:YdeI/OmpD-associated family protein [Candidatus Micrarchaeota archaeon]